MNVVFKLIATLFLLLFVQGKGVRFDNFQPRRPIKYFFHLLELKSEFNPLLYPTVTSGKVCSSKVGPFCQITCHSPIKTHELREMTAEAQNIKAQLLASIKYTYETYQNVERSQNQLFLIRTSLVNMYEAYLKKQIGDLNKEEMLSPSKFKRLLEQ